jgi:hypothetical protein
MPRALGCEVEYNQEFADFCVMLPREMFAKVIEEEN